jgi:hypothetical protein
MRGLVCLSSAVIPIPKRAKSAIDSVKQPQIRTSNSLNLVDQLQKRVNHETPAIVQILTSPFPFQKPEMKITANEKLKTIRAEPIIFIPTTKIGLFPAIKHFGEDVRVCFIASLKLHPAGCRRASPQLSFKELI